MIGAFIIFLAVLTAALYRNYIPGRLTAGLVGLSVTYALSVSHILILNELNMPNILPVSVPPLDNE